MMFVVYNLQATQFKPSVLSAFDEEPGSQ